jgi:signal transduction histidine kinase
VLFLLLIGGLTLLVILLLREVQLNERQSNFISAVTHELRRPWRRSSSTSTPGSSATSR